MHDLCVRGSHMIITCMTCVRGSHMIITCMTCVCVMVWTLSLLLQFPDVLSLETELPHIKSAAKVE